MFLLGWLTSLAGALPAYAVVKEKYSASEARNAAHIEQITKLKDDLRLCEKAKRRLELRIDDLSPGTVEPVEEWLLVLMSRSEDDYLDAEALAGCCAMNRHEVRLRLLNLADHRYLGVSDQGQYYLTRKALVYLWERGYLADTQALNDEEVRECLEVLKR